MGLHWGSTTYSTAIFSTPGLNENAQSDCKKFIGFSTKDNDNTENGITNFPSRDLLADNSFIRIERKLQDYDFVFLFFSKKLGIIR
jgi:hypothetical protein